MYQIGEGDRPEPWGDYAAQRNERRLPGSASIGLGRSNGIGGCMDRPADIGPGGRDEVAGHGELGAADGTVHLHEVSIGECTVAACSAETLGLSIADGKTTLAGLQRQLVQAQTARSGRS